MNTHTTSPESRDECHCIVYHPGTPEERQKVVDHLEYARKIGDVGDIPIIIAQLGPCPSRQESTQHGPR